MFGIIYDFFIYTRSSTFDGMSFSEAESSFGFSILEYLDN